MAEEKLILAVTDSVIGEIKSVEGCFHVCQDVKCMSFVTVGYKDLTFTMQKY